MAGSHRLILPAFLPDTSKQFLGWIIEACMLVTNVFMLVWGIRLCEATWDQTIAEFPAVSVGLTYLPIPISGGLTMLFIVERLMTRKFFSEPEVETVSQLTTE